MEKRVNFVSKIKSLSENDNSVILSESEALNIKGGKTYYWEIVDGKIRLVRKGS
jgi:hypothetical protein